MFCSQNYLPCPQLWKHFPLLEFLPWFPLSFCTKLKLFELDLQVWIWTSCWKQILPPHPHFQGSTLFFPAYISALISCDSYPPMPCTLTTLPSYHSICSLALLFHTITPLMCQAILVSFSFFLKNWLVRVGPVLVLYNCKITNYTIYTKKSQHTKRFGTFCSLFFSPLLGPYVV